jgi:hypothetical protein
MDKVGMPGDPATTLRWLMDPQRREYGEFLDAQDDRDPATVYREYRDRIEGAPESAEDDEGCCPGHESLGGAHMGESVYCDGTCQG